MILPDVLVEGLAVVFCGTAAGKKSAEQQAYYAESKNKFWPVLYRTGLTLRQFRPEEYPQVLARDIGLTDLSKVGSGADSEINEDDYDVAGLFEKLTDNRPAVVAFNGKTAFQAAFKKDHCSYGRQSETIGEAVVYVLPSTSYKAHSHWSEDYWKELAAEVRRIRKLSI